MRPSTPTFARKATMWQTAQTQPVCGAEGRFVAIERNDHKPTKGSE